MPTKNKYKIPNDVKLTVINIIRGQERRKAEYSKRYDDIINGTSAPFVEYELKHNDKTETARAFLPKSNGSNISSTESKALALKALDEEHWVFIMNTVTAELAAIGGDIHNQKLRQQVIKAVYLNCISRSYPYEYFYLPGISRKSFFRYKNIFIFNLANKFKLL